MCCIIFEKHHDTPLHINYDSFISTTKKYSNEAVFEFNIKNKQTNKQTNEYKQTTISALVFGIASGILRAIVKYYHFQIFQTTMFC